MLLLSDRSDPPFDHGIPEGATASAPGRSSTAILETPGNPTDGSRLAPCEGLQTEECRIADVFRRGTLSHHQRQLAAEYSLITALGKLEAARDCDPVHASPFAAVRSGR